MILYYEETSGRYAILGQ